MSSCTCPPSTHHEEHRTRLVFILTVTTMVTEILAGWWFGSMALLADGWHMAGHAGAMAIAWFAYAFARKRHGDPSFVFGPGKINALAGFVSSIGLGLVAVLMVGESLHRLVTPQPIAFTEATVVAVLGLVVNLASAWILHDPKGSHTTDHNLKAAYLHVLADALTSILAIAALVGGALWGWTRLDPIMGMVGAAVVGKWAVGLLRETAAILLDRSAPVVFHELLRRKLEATGASVRELALWYIGPQRLAASISLAAASPHPPETYLHIARSIPEVAFVRVEIHPIPCPGEVSHA